MKTIDDEFTDAALTWMDKQAKAGKPFFCYYNSTRMHVFTHLKKESEGARRALAFIQTAWSNTMGTLGSY